MTLRLLGSVLCGGKSSRMGTNKSNLKHDSGTTFLQHSCERLEKICNQVIVSGNPSDSTYPVVLDVVADRGPVAGIASVLGYACDCNFDACLVTPVDMPDLSVDDLCVIKQTWLSHPRQTTCGISADAQLQPLVAIYPAALLDEITKLTHSDDRSLRRWMEKLPHSTVTLSTPSCRNVNRPEDL